MSGTPPRRRHSPAVYRRRRLVLLLALIVVVAVVWLLIAQPWRGAASTPPPASAVQQTPDAATELPVPNGSGQEATGAPSAAATESAAAPVGAAPCVKENLTVEALTDQDSYGSGQNPELSMRLTNAGEEDCALNVGTSTQVFTVSSGSDVWWRSTDCQSEPSDMVVLLAAGQSVTSATPIAWDRTRSAVGTCDDTERPAAPGGGASYHVSVEIGGISSVQEKHLLLY